MWYRTRAGLVEAVSIERSLRLVTSEGGQEGAPGDYWVTWPDGKQEVWPRARFEALFAPAAARPTAKRTLACAAEALAEEEPLSARELMSATGCTYESARSTLSRLAKSGVLRRVRAGWYERAKEGGCGEPTIAREG